MGQFFHLMIHTTATPIKRKVSIADLHQWQIVERGWRQLGYADMFHQDGTVENIVEYDNDNWIESNEITNGAIGFNGTTRHIVVVGGKIKIGKKSFNANTLTEAQFYSLQSYIKELLFDHPDLLIMAHYHGSDKTCPNFYVPGYLELMNIPEKNIYRSDRDAEIKEQFPIK